VVDLGARLHARAAAAKTERIISSVYGRPVNGRSRTAARTVAWTSTNASRFQRFFRSSVRPRHIRVDPGDYPDDRSAVELKDERQIS
jgi:hypothetical protein